MNAPAASEPPPIRQPRHRRLVLAIAGGAVAIILLLILLNIDTATRPQGNSADDATLIELIPPTPLEEGDITGGVSNFTRNLSELGTENTWIQTTTKEGELSQQYRFASHDPNPEGLPPGWSKVNQPEIEIYLSDDRVMTLRSETALLRAPSRTLESGTMSGGVDIRFYDLKQPRVFDKATSTLIIQALTEEASFDNIQGEVRCDGRVDIESATARLPGSGLRVQINELDKRVEWLRMESVGEIRLSAIAEDEITAPASQPQGQGPTTAPAAPRKQPLAQPDAPPFYRLTLQKNVQIHQGDQATGWNAAGDNLHIIFSMESKNLGRSIASADSSNDSFPARLTPGSASWSGESQGVSIMSALAAASLATMEDEPAPLFIERDDDIIVSCEGGITMSPLVNAAERPQSPNDSRLELVGQPVRLHSNEHSADVTCQGFVYHSQAQRIVARGSAAHPLIVEAPELRVQAERFALNRRRNTGAFEGEGWMLTREQADPAGPTLAIDNSTADLRIQWQDRVDLAFDKPVKKSDQREGMGKLKSAAFKGNVEVTSDDIVLRADGITAAFPTSDAAESSGNPPGNHSIDSMVAQGAVKALSLADEGSLACDKLDVRFARSADGRTVPQHMIAIGQVAAVDPDKQTVWADRLDVAFDTSGANPPADAPPGSAARRAAAKVKSLTAVDDVQVVMVDGARAFADRLDADAQAEAVVLTGKDVMVLNDRAAIHQGTRLELRKATNSAYWPGPGQFAYFTSAILDSGPQRVTRPVIDEIDPAANPVQIRTTWLLSMTYDGTVNDGAGALTLTGSVQGQSWPSALEYNTTSSQSLTMQFAQALGDAPAAPPDVADGSALGDIAARGKRQLKMFIAQGDAKLESRTWLKTDHSDKPRVFHVSGPHINYDALTLDASVLGPGELLVRDEQIIANAPQSGDGSKPFSAKGTTLFRWKEHLQMKHGEGAMHDIEMLGGVEVRHRAIDGLISTVAARRLNATVERTGDATGPRNAAFDLGGMMELRRLKGAGGVYVHTKTRDVDCQEFDYDYASGDAMLSANPGRSVTILTTGSPHPLRAQRVIWNLITDKITATNPRGTAPR